MEQAQLIQTTQYLTFTIDQELFALDIHKVREVLDFTTITKVPQAPEYLRGVINLRGSVMPVMDMRLRFGMPEAEKTVNTCVIITEVSISGETLVLGAMADSVQEVIDLEPEQIEPPPRFGSKLNTSFLRGMGKHKDGFIMILDLDQVFSAEEMSRLDGDEEMAGVGEIAGEAANV